MSSVQLHEPVEVLSEGTVNLHRAIVSLMEELEAIDWYRQRADAATDPALKEVLLHNRNEEIEHAMMVLEWIRRNDPDFERHSRTYLFTTAPITEIESVKKAQEQGGAAGESKRSDEGGGPLSVGSLRRD